MGKKTKNKAATATELDPTTGANLSHESEELDSKSALEANSQKEEEEVKTDSKSDSQGEDSTAENGKEKKKTTVSVLEQAGKTAIARHGFKEVFVTSDGLAFPLLSDANNHASALFNKEIIKVKE